MKRIITNHITHGIVIIVTFLFSINCCAWNNGGGYGHDRGFYHDGGSYYHAGGYRDGSTWVGHSYGTVIGVPMGSYYGAGYYAPICQNVQVCNSLRQCWSEQRCN
jgi:hypothetical protein